MELRDIEIFLTLAEELHFGRTADRLRVSQARVSQAIKQQESRIGGPLFERTSRSVALTPLGANLRDDLAAGYGAIIDGVAKAKSAAQGLVGSLRLGVMGSDSAMFLDCLAEFGVRHPGAEVATKEIHFGDAFGPLRRGEVDAIVVWGPVREPDLVAGPAVFTTGRVLGVWPGHPAAQRESVTLEDLADYVCGDPVGEPAYWADAMLPRVTPSGRIIERKGSRPTTYHEVLTLTAGRRCVLPAGANAVYYAALPGVAFVPIVDAPPLDWVLVWRAGADGPLVKAFADVCRDLRGSADPSPA